MASKRFFPWLLAFSLHLRHGMCQSPGPDWPNCAAASQAFYGGWEFDRLSFQPSIDGRPDARDATLKIDAQNAADGSRTVCSLSANVTGAALNVTLDSSSGGCETGWSERYEDFTNQTQRASTAVVTFDVVTKELSINQTWTCREKGQLLTFVGTASGVVNMTCSSGKEGERTSCSAVDLNNILEPPFFLGPATVVRSPPNPASTSATGTQPLLSAPDCQSLQRKWQVLSMTFVPPGPQPKSPSYWPTSIRAEFRNIDDGSRTLCELGAENVTDYEQGILLHNDGEPLDILPENQNRPQGCLTGWWHDKIPTEDDPTLQEWRWSQPANVTFNTKTHVLSISQTYYCVRGTHSVVSGSVAQELKMDCKESGNQYYPIVCEPTAALYSNSSGPIILGTPAQ